MNSRPVEFAAWARSPEGRAHSRRVAAKGRAVMAAQPKCGARRRSGGTCQNPAPLGGNGRCRLHGGAVPRGDSWHVRQFPTKGPGAAAKLARKLARWEKDDRARAAWLATLSPEERERFDRWCRTYRPGPKSARARAKLDREAAGWLQALMRKHGEEEAARRKGRAGRRSDHENEEIDDDIFA